MRLIVRSRKRVMVEVDGESYQVEIVEVPFREGLEMRCFIGDEELRVGDRGLGEEEAVELLRGEIRRVKASYSL